VDIYAKFDKNKQFRFPKVCFCFYVRCGYIIDGEVSIPSQFDGMIDFREL
jgi:hypothetical protein